MKGAAALILSAVLILTLIPLFSAPFYAVMEDGGATSLSYPVAQHYVIIIPEAVTVENGGGSAVISLEAGSLVEADHTLNVSISKTSNGGNSVFRLRSTAKDSIYLPYTIKADGRSVTYGQAFFAVGADNAYAGAKKTLTFKTDEPKYSGEYRDVLTFAVSVTPD